MKYTPLLFLLILFTHCKPDNNPVPGTASVVIKVSHKVGTAPAQYGQMIYTNAAGNKYKINLLKYYLSNFVFVKDDGTLHKASNYELIDAFDSASCLLQFTGLPEGNYTSIKFALGIDSVRNHTGLQEGDLDPINGMIWTWNTGYIFFKHEGQFLDGAMNVQQLFYHYGTDKAYTPIQLNVNNLNLKDVSKTVYIDFDLNKLYGTPNVINFIDNNIHESLSVDDGKWMKEMQENFKTSFSFVKAE
jgi:hypothetical protein